MNKEEMLRALEWAFSIARNEWCVSNTEMASTNKEEDAIRSLIEKVSEWQEKAIELCNMPSDSRVRSLDTINAWAKFIVEIRDFGKEIK